MPPKTRHQELRCFCSREPLLATYGRDSKGELYVHVKIFKQKRLYGEVVVTRGTVKIRCRECFRWNKVVIKQPDKVSLEEDESPLPSDEQNAEATMIAP